MNREIKFRVWNSKMGYFVSLDDTMDYHFYLGTKANIEMYYDGSSVDMNNFIVEQYIGIKDVTGKEIYEGDIVETIYDDTPRRKGEIVYTPEVGAYRVKCGNQLLPVVTYRVVEGKPQGLLSVTKVVIGNIHEHSILLKL